MGLMQDTMAVDPQAVPPQEVQPGAQQKAPIEQTKSKLPEQSGGDDPTAQFGEGEMEEDQYEDAFERVMLAAVKVMATPDMEQELAAMGDNPDAKTLADFCFDLLKALNEKAKGKIPEEVLPAAVCGIVEHIANAIELDPKIVAEATQRCFARFLVETGADPKEIDAVMQGMDYDFIVGTAESEARGEEPKPFQPKGAPNGQPV
jgi:hypothetical protein